MLDNEGQKEKYNKLSKLVIFSLNNYPDIIKA